ncbi:MAG: S1 RNA-binding domain-containing protein [Bdellovibrionaceae bacterium]|nr:S1 RNA-binding domain-containing protein [Pseudobdellovibrionaceae bacterium]
MSRKNNSLFEEEAKAADDFGALLDQSFRGLERGLRVGDNFKGEILSIGKEDSFVSTGTPTDGLIPTLELLDENKQIKYKVGDLIEVVVLKVRDGEVRLRLRSAKGAAELDSLEDAFDMELPVEGKVLEAVKGGFRVSVMGKTAFCPISQIDSRPVTDTTQFIGNKYEFVLTQFEKAGRNIVVSRRKLLDQQKAEAEGEFMTAHKPEDIVEGKVTRLDTFGAFVELVPGVEGLVHISEISWARLQHPSELLQQGMPVRVKILKMEDHDGRLRISLSIKQGGGESDPWLQISQKFPLGSVWDGTVTKKESFGLFVSLAPGFQGLLPRSKWRDSTEAASFENKKKGDPIKIRIDEIRAEERRISLGVPGEEGDESWRQHPAGGAITAGKGLGTFGDLLKDFKPKR